MKTKNSRPPLGPIEALHHCDSIIPLPEGRARAVVREELARHNLAAGRHGRIEGTRMTHFTDVDGRITRLVEQSVHDSVTFDACDRLASDYLARGEVPPEALRAWLVERLRGQRGRPRRQGRHKADKAARDVAVLAAMLRIVGRGWPPTVNESSAGRSAAQIVSEVLRDDFREPVTAKRIAEIWAKFRPASK